MLNFLSRTIDISDYEMCESDITFDEICRSVNGMKKGKTPGPDGLTCEFYCKFINEFKDTSIFFHVFNCIENEGQLSRLMRHSVINLIFKKKGDKNDIKSYRPITLANVDYKILARIMANRLKLTLTKIISNTQTCSVIGRDISDTVCSIINVIDLIDEEELEAYILKTDQEKAFDRHADDTTFSLANRKSIFIVFDILKIYSGASGAKINKEKSEILILENGYLIQNDIEQLGIKICDNVIEVLGVWAGKFQEKCNILNWEKKISSITTVLDLWKRRHLSFHGRFAVISSLLMSKLWYTLTVQTMPSKYYLQIKKICVDFLWNFKTHQVAYETIILEKSKGGLHFPDIMLKMFAFRLKFLSRLLNSDYFALWKNVCIYFLSKIENMNLGKEILICELKQSSYSKLPFSVREMLLAWSKMKTYVAFEANENNIHEIPLFFNYSITKEGKLPNYKPFIFAGITKVKHLTYEVIPGFLKFIAIHEILSEKDADLKYDDVCKFYRNVLVSLPPEWVHFINENINPVSKNFEITAYCFSFSVEDKEVPMPQGTRTFYNLLIQLVGKSPVSESYWIEKYPELELSKCFIFSNLYILPGECRELNFQVLHRTLFTKVKLLKCNMSDNDTCPVCAQSREDLETRVN
ncbi:unnamed protein product [Mytilus coruscus]|uniref:Reverse transcriptase domain-containing protein n=1 Tax=Mytilus coruscus TaxID=42192 RepID=A0A6J8EWP1_MYTCO|nr:unnamed protein product [Mytilus coruscus]